VLIFFTNIILQILQILKKNKNKSYPYLTKYVFFHKKVQFLIVIIIYQVPYLYLIINWLNYTLKQLISDLSFYSIRHQTHHISDNTNIV